jgi:hypothetical protein
MADQTTISARFQLSLADVYWVSWRGRFRRHRWYFVFFLLAILAAVCAIFTNSASFCTNDLELADVGSAHCDFYSWTYVFFVAPYFSARELFKAHPELSLPTTYTFSDHGFDSVDQRSQTHTDWAQVLEARETAHHFLLYGTTGVHILKKSFLNGRGEQAALRIQIRTHVAKAKLHNS